MHNQHIASVTIYQTKGPSSRDVGSWSQVVSVEIFSEHITVGTSSASLSSHLMIWTSTTTHCVNVCTCLLIYPMHLARTWPEYTTNINGWSFYLCTLSGCVYMSAHLLGKNITRKPNIRQDLYLKINYSKVNQCTCVKVNQHTTYWYWWLNCLWYRQSTVVLPCVQTDLVSHL